MRAPVVPRRPSCGAASQARTGGSTHDLRAGENVRIGDDVTVGIDDHPDAMLR
jgi:hypothetical protein